MRRAKPVYSNPRRRRRNPKKVAPKKASSKKAASRKTSKKAASKKASSKKAASRKTSKKAASPKAVVQVTTAAPKKAASRKSSKKAASRKSSKKGGKRKSSKKGGWGGLTAKQRASRIARMRRTRAKNAGAHGEAAYRARRAEGKDKASRARRRIGRAYLMARSVARGVDKKRIGGKNAELARAMGLTSINPSIKGIATDVGRLMIPVVLPGVTSFVGVMAAAQWAGSKIAERTANVHLRRAAVPVTGLVISGALYGTLKMSKSAKVQRAAGAVFIGGAIGSMLLALLHTEMGQKLAAKLKLPITLTTPTEGQVAAGASAAADVASGTVKGVEITPAMVGAYAVIKDYMGAALVHESPGNWFGRQDMGAYVGKGAQNALGAYAASNFPIHDAGPGDNVRNSARLLSGFSGDLALKDTPLGTEIVGLGGVFDGESSI
jgi:hypothetical protein